MAEVKKEKTTDTTAQKNQSRPSNLCCYSQRVCNLEKLKGFDFCHKHILEDKASPFKPCDFYAKINDRRCMNPAPKMSDKEKSYCLIHTRKAELHLVVEKRKKKRQREDSSTIEDYGEGSTTEKRRRTSSCASQKSLDGVQKDEEEQTSDEELSTELGVGGSQKVDSAWHGDVDSDAESVDSEEEDHLRHAGTWTLDEVTKMCCDKMTRLKSLYMAQYKRLFHVMKEKRRKYLQLIQAEQENEGEKYVSPSEILGTSTHSKRHSVEAILHKQSKEKRHGLTQRHQISSYQRCTHVSDGTRCANKILPLTKFCIHHISHDPNQLLFQSCSFKAGDNKICSNVVPKIYSYSTCQLHMRLPAEPIRTNVEKDLEEAAKRDQERKAAKESHKNFKGFIKPFPDVSEMAMQDKQLPVPKALQQKSSALIPPLAPVSTTDDTSNASDISNKESLPSQSKQHSIPSLKLEKMELDPPTPLESTESTPRELMSPVSGASTPAGIKSISPTLLAASLVAVCSAAPSVTPAHTTSTSDLSNAGKESTSTSKFVPPGVVSTTSDTFPQVVSNVSTVSSISTSTCPVTSTCTSVIPSGPSTSDSKVDESVSASTASSLGSSAAVSTSKSSSLSTEAKKEGKSSTECSETQVTSSTSLNTSSAAVTSYAGLQSESSTNISETSSTQSSCGTSSSSLLSTQTPLSSQTDSEAVGEQSNKTETTKDT